MKTQTLICFATALLLALTLGYAEEFDAANPEDVVEGFHRAVSEEKDKEKAAGFVIASQRDDFRAAWDQVVRQAAAMPPLPQEPEMTVQVDGEQASVTIENWDMPGTATMNLTREDGAWWVVN